MSTSKRNFPSVLISGRQNKIKRYTRKMLMNVPGHVRLTPQEKILIKRGIIKPNRWRVSDK